MPNATPHARDELVSVIVPNWNGASIIKPCIDSLQRQTYSALELVIVDNGSTDGSPEMIQRDYPGVRVVRLPENRGFCEAVNAGVEVASGSIVALLNNDAVADPKWLERSVARLSADSKAGAVAAKIVQQGAPLLDSTGVAMSQWGIPFPRDRDQPEETEAANEVFAISGGAAVIRKELLEHIGLFDEAFFMYYEDADLSFRARLAGFTITYEAEAVVHHRIGASSGGGYTSLVRYHSVKNAWALYFKNMPGSLFWKYLPLFLLAQVLVLGNSARHGLLIHHLRGLARAVLSVPATLRVRREIQRGRVVSKEEIVRLLTPGPPPSYRAHRPLFQARNSSS